MGVCPGPAPCSLFVLWFRCFGMNYGKRGFPMTLLRLESFSLFVDRVAYVSWDTCLARNSYFIDAGKKLHDGLWWSRSICPKLRSCLPIWECRQALPGRGDWLSRFCSRVRFGSGSAGRRYLAVQTLFESQIWSGWFTSGSFCPRLLSRMVLLSTGDSRRAICLCSLRKGAQEQVFAGVDGSERYARRLLAGPSRWPGDLGISDPVTSSAHAAV